MSKTGISAPASVRHSSAVRSSGRPNIVALWMGGSFLIAVAFAAILLVIFGTGSQGTDLALRVTARWSFLLFWLAYAGSAMTRLFGPCLAGLARSGRELGLAFASAQSVHVGLVLWRFHGLGPGMVFFWVGTFCTYLLALFSLPPLRGRLAPRLWRTFRTIAVEYIALVFVADFIVFPVLNNGLNKYPLTYLPFALMIVSGVGLRVLSHCFFRKV